HAPGVRAHAHDRARLAHDHAVQHRACAVDHAPQVELDLALPLRPLLLDTEAIGGPADVVDEDVHAAGPALDLAHHRLHRLPAGHVGRHESSGGGAERPGLGRDLRALPLVDLPDGGGNALTRHSDAHAPP